VPEIPGYSVNAKLAEGACAEIYAALEHATGRLVAIKILHPRNVDNKAEQTRLVEEGALLSRLGQDENIIQTYRAGSIGKQPYIVMEYVRGVGLRELLAKGKRFNDLEVLKLAKGLCRALRFLHNNNILHKDVKPDNIMITEEGTVKLLDFGFAEKIRSFSLFGGKKTLEGSPAYMAPELLLTRKPSPATDIYALGCTLFEAATGAPPFSGLSTSQIISLQADVNLAARSVCASNHGITAATEKTILTACQKDVVKRFKSVDEILLDLARNQGWRAERKPGESQRIAVGFA
jgi:serine/threonine-protein kinase